MPSPECRSGNVTRQSLHSTESGQNAKRGASRAKLRGVPVFLGVLVLQPVKPPPSRKGSGRGGRATVARPPRALPPNPTQSTAKVEPTSVGYSSGPSSIPRRALPPSSLRCSPFALLSSMTYVRSDGQDAQVSLGVGGVGLESSAHKDLSAIQGVRRASFVSPPRSDVSRIAAGRAEGSGTLATVYVSKR